MEIKSLGASKILRVFNILDGVCMLRVLKSILIMLCALCIAGTHAFAYNLQPTLENPIYSLTETTDSTYNFGFKYLNDMDSLEIIYYNLNLLSAYISTHSQLQFESSNTESNNTIKVTLPNQNIILKYSYTKPETYTETSVRIDSVESAEIKELVFKDIVSTQNGGAIYNTSPNPVFIQADFINNKTSEASGGALYNQGQANVDGVFMDNTVTGTDVSGGAIYNATFMTISADFVKNSVQGTNAKGGAISNIATESNNSIDDISGCFTGNYVMADNQDALGGAIYNYGETHTKTAAIDSISASFLANSATAKNGNAAGGAIYNGGRFSEIKEIKSDFISNTTKANNSSSGGAIHNSSTIENIRGDFISNASSSSKETASGGAVFNNGEIGSLKGNFISNSTTGSTAQGGAITNIGTLDLQSQTFTDNKTSSSTNDSTGGAIYNSGVLKIYNETIFSGNYSYSSNGDSKGGAIYNIGEIENTLSGEFNENYTSSITGDSFGGSIYNSGYISGLDSSFTSSYTKGNSSFGGAIYNTNEITTLKSNFTQNKSTASTLAQGGAIYSSGLFHNINSVFKQNSAESTKQAEGGAIYNVGDIFAFKTDERTASFTENYVSSGTLSASGGAIYNKGSLFDINQVNFIENHSKSDNSDAMGGAIFNDGYITEITENTFYNNYTFAQKGNAKGGAIYNSGTINTISTDLRNNSSGGKSANGGAIYNTGFIIEIKSNIEGNFASATTENAYGGAIYNTGSITGGIINSTFSNNYAYSTSGEAYGGAIYTLANLLIKADNGRTLFEGNYVQTGNGDKVAQAIYVGSTSATLTLNATNNGTILFEDSINGQKGYNISLTGDSTGIVNFNNKVYNATVVLNNINLKFNENTFAQTNSELITTSGIINFIDGDTKNYTVSNLTSNENASYSIDVNPLNKTADTITIENLANGTIKIDNINYLNELKENVIIRILYTNSDNIKLALANEVPDLMSAVPNTVYNTDEFIQESGATVIDNHTIKLLYGTELDTLKLINEKITAEGEIREFVFATDSDNTYKVRANLSSIGITSEGEQHIIGTVVNDVRSSLDFSSLTGFNLENKSILKISNTSLKNSKTPLIVNNSDAVAILNNVEITNNETAINNLSGTVNITNSIIEAGTDTAANSVINNSIMTLDNSEIKSGIENSGTLSINSNAELRGNITNSGTIQVSSENNNFYNTVTNNGTIQVDGQAIFTSSIEGTGTTKVNDTLILDISSIFSETQGLNIQEGSTVNVNGGTLIVNTSGNDVLNGRIIGNSGELQIKNSNITEKQFLISNNSDIRLILTDTVMDFTNDGYRQTYLGNLVSTDNSSFKLDINFLTNESDKLKLHSDSNAIINISELNGLSKDLIPTNRYVVFNILNDDTNAQLYIADSIIKEYSIISELSDFLNTTNNTYEVSSTDFIGIIGIQLDDSKKSIMIGNLTGYDTLNYLNIQDDIKRSFRVKNSGYLASKSVGSTGTGSMEVFGDGNNSSLYIIDLNNKYSGFEIDTKTNLTLKDITVQNGVASLDIGAGAGLKVLNSDSTIIVNNVVFSNNTANISGAAIYNAGVISDLVNTSFYGNYVFNNDSSETIHGGAIYSIRDLTVKADNGNSVFNGNFIQSGSDEKVYEAVYIAEAAATLTLQATNNGTITFDDIINGANGYKIIVTGDETGVVKLNNKVYNANVELNNSTLVIGTDTFNNSNSILKVTTGTLSTADNTYDNYIINNLVSSSDANYVIDFNLFVDENDVLQYNTDTITVTDSSSTGTIKLSEQTFAKYGLDDKDSQTSQYLFNHKDSYFVVKVLENNGNNKITLSVEDKVQNYSVEYYNYNVKSSDFIGKIGFRGIGDDSFEIGVLSNQDTLSAINQYSYLDGVRTFTLEDVYILTAANIGVTGEGKFEIIGNDHTINFNGRSGFVISSAGKNEVIINNTVLSNSSCAIEHNNINSESTVTLNKSILSDNTTAINSYGKIYFNSVKVNQGTDVSPNSIINNGELYLNGTNTLSSNINGYGNIYLESGITDLTNGTIDNNVLNLNAGELKIGSNTFANATLAINGGNVIIGDGLYTQYNFNRLNINSEFITSIDIDINNDLTDTFYVGTGSTGSIILTDFNSFKMPAFVEYKEIQLLYKADENDSIKIELSDELKNNSVVSYSIDRYFQGNKYVADDTDYICEITLSTNETQDSLIIQAERDGSVLSIFNQYKYKERIFNIVSDEYIEDYDLGKTAAGKMTVTGNNHILNFNNHSGFELSNKSAVLTLDSVNIKNAHSIDGSVINAANYSGTAINIIDSSFEDNISDSLGGAIYTSTKLTIKAENNDVVFNNNIANGVANSIYLNNSKNTGLAFTLIANEGHTVAINDGIDFNKTGLTININDKTSNGRILLSGNLGTSESKLVNFKLNGGTLSFADSVMNQIYVKAITVNKNTFYQFDVDVLNETSDMIVLPSKVTVPKNKLVLNEDSFNMLSYLEDSEDSAAIRILDTTLATSKFFKFSDTDNLFAKYIYDDNVYYFLMEAEGYLVISRDKPDYFMHPLVRAIRNPISNTYTMKADDILYNYGSLSKNPTQNNVQSAQFIIKGNKHSIVAGKLEDSDETLQGIAVSGADGVPAGQQMFLVYDVTFKNFRQAIINNGGNVTLSNVRFEDNDCGVYNNGLLEATKTTFYKNHSIIGGALLNENSANITGSNFNYNTADYYGGAIYNDITAEGKVLTLTTTKLIYNTTANENGFGGAIYNNSGRIDLLGSTVSSNSACTGGAIYNLGTIVIDKSGKTKTTFTNNTGTFGGAIYNKGTLNTDNATFTSNSAESAGGALFLSILPNAHKITANINNTTFSKNASDVGGAIYALGNTNDRNEAVYNYVTINNSSFTSNKADLYGGAIYADTNSKITIIDSSFKNNTAGLQGGAIFINGGAEVSIFAQTKNVVFSGNKAGGVYNGIYLNSYEDSDGNIFNAVLNLQTSNGKTISFNDYIAGVGTINVYGNTVFNNAVITKDSQIEVIHHDGVLTIMNEANLAGMALQLTGKGDVNLANNRVGALRLSTLKLDANTNTSIDASLKNKTSDKIQAETVTGDGKLNVSSVNLVSNSKTPVTINVGENSVVSSISAKTAESAEATYKLKSYYDENGLLRVVAYGQRAKPSAVAAPVAAQIGGYLTQINSYDQAFMNMDMNMLVPRSEREAMQQTYSCENKDGIEYNGKGLWNRPYATFERVNLNNGPKVNNIGYGNYFGGDADMKQLNNGWRRQFSAYVGYNGSVQDYDRQSIDQNGGTVGVTEVWYKNNFFTGLTLNAGANVAQASTDLGRENMPMFMTGIASKTGYNFEFKECKFIVQPSLLLSYSFIHTFAHDNGLGHRVSSSPLNAIQVAPGIKFIANLKNGWQPYFNVNMRWNIIDKTHFSLADVTIPDMSIDPYVEYGLGLQRRWGERFTGFGQAMIRNGGRNGVMLSFGFKWLLGR